MAKAVPMKKVWEARSLILHGKTVKEVSQYLNISEAVVRNYTKAERAKVRR